MKITKDSCLGIGHYDKYPRYYLIGQPSDFYVWRAYDEKSHKESGWIKGNLNLWHEGKKAHKKGKKHFMEYVDKILEEI